MNSIISFLGQGIKKGEINGLPTTSANDLLIGSLNLVYFVAGVVAVIMIIFAGIMYTTANGDSGRVAKAKNLLMYAIIGLVVVVLAFVITGFVRGAMTK